MLDWKSAAVAVLNPLLLPLHYRSSGGVWCGKGWPIPIWQTHSRRQQIAVKERCYLHGFDVPAGALWKALQSQFEQHSAVSVYSPFHFYWSDVENPLEKKLKAWKKKQQNSHVEMRNRIGWHWQQQLMHTEAFARFFFCDPRLPSISWGLEWPPLHSERGQH